VPSRWTQHLVYLDALRLAGCQFSLDDLTRDEWEGLMLIESERADLQKQEIEKRK